MRTDQNGSHGWLLRFLLTTTATIRILQGFAFLCKEEPFLETSPGLPNLSVNEKRKEFWS